MRALYNIYIRKGKCVPAHALKACRMSGGITPLVLNIGLDKFK